MSALASRKLYLPLFVILLVVLPFLWARTSSPPPPPPPPPAPSASQILKIHAGSLTSYLAGATSIQDIQPRVEQRGVNVDGSMRAASTHPMHLAGNPFGSAWTANQTLNGLRLATGHYSPFDIDIALPADTPWVIARTFNARQDNAGSHHDSDGYQGKNWHQTSQPEIEIYWKVAEGTKDADDVLYLVYGADGFLEFQRYDATSDEFKGMNGAAGMFEFVDGGTDPDTYIYHDQWGYKFTFFGFDTDAGSAAGQFWKTTDPEGKEAYAGDASLANDPITLGYDTGRITTAYDSENRRYSYTYTTLNGTKRLTEVKAETKTGGTWSSPTGVATVAEVDYEYYGDETYGDIGGLKMVTITNYLTGSGVTQTKKTLYRYWEGTFNASSNPGHPHTLKLIVDFDGTRQYDWTDSLFDEDFKTASHASLEGYSSAYFEYDSSYRVNEAFFNGACGCGGASNGTHLFEYETNSNYTDNSGYDTAWSVRTVVKRPDATYLTQYFDEAAQSLHQVITDADPDNTSPAPSRWIHEITRNSDGIVTDISTPANITGYTHAEGSFSISTSTTAGLVWTYVLETTGDTKSFVLDRKYKTGTSGTAYYAESTGYTTGSITPQTDITVVRPVVNDEKAYVNQVSASPASTDYEHTQHTVTFSSGKLVVREIKTEHPIVTTGNLGPGGTTGKKTTRIFSQQGRVEWVEGPLEDPINHSDYTGGVLAKTIQDAASGDGIPSELAADVNAVSRDTVYTYDAQGRRTKTTPNSGPVVFRYFTKLKDERLITLTYADYNAGTPTYYGPVQFTVTNQAGQVEVSGTIGLTSTTTALTGHIDETKSDPLLAIDIGTVDAMTKHRYDEAGQTRDETWAYFSIPTSGNGTEGTHYDATYFGYDDMGRRRRTKEPHGTIRRTVFDALGRTQKRLIGTNDSSYAGGEPSGTDDMVATEILEYDSNADDGNNYLTKRTLRIQDSATDERVTIYDHDVRGNVIVVTSPTAPYILNKVDNLGRVIAVGEYSSSSGLDTGDDPTSLATNRVGLRQTFYNERGWVWKSQIDKIDLADGSDDNQILTRTWYDAEGKVIKVDGPQLTKTFYDRLGRQTHSFILAEDDDTAYADADDVTGDIVLLERQTTYESSDSDDVLMQATISRHHDDVDTGETTGALDTNADADDLLYTAGNLKGRIQITAMWYDSLGRLTDSVEYGTNGGSNFARDGLTVPTRSDTALVTTFAYYDDGPRKSVTDPRNLETRFEYDDAGRQTAVIRNYVNGIPSSKTGDDDVFTRTVYTDGLRTKLWVDFDGDDVIDTGDQDTLYTFGTTKGATAGDSKIGTGHLLQKVQYPDSSGGTDVVTFAYNAQSQEIWRKDQAGNILEKDYDDSGRLEHDRATTVASGFDGDIKRITFSYDSRGRRERVTQYDNATVGSGTVQDETMYTYDNWGLIKKIEQDNNSAVSGGGDDYEISYTDALATAGRNVIRRTKMTYPSGMEYTFKYRNTSGRHDGKASRVTEIERAIPPAVPTTIVKYQYNGVSQRVSTEYAAVSIKRERFGTTSGSYDAWDNFDRVEDDTWVTDLATDKSIHDVNIAYDRNSNITSVDDTVHSGFDVKYTMDGLDRLTNAQEGTLSGGSITSETREQTWTLLDQVGNWDHAKLDLNGDGDYIDTDEYDDDRTHNDANEITGRDTDDNGTDNYNPTYDAAGNLTDDKEDYKYEYDVWYRLRRVKNQSDALVAEHRYNGLGYRIAEHVDTDTDGDVDVNDDWHYFLYDERWRIVATFEGSDSAPTEEFFHQAAGDAGFGGASYIDDVVLRDRDTTENGTLDETMYYLQNWRYDVVALIDDGGDQREMVRYSAYGVPFGLPGGDTDSDDDNDATDITQIQTWIDASAYDMRGDIDLDGDVDSTDKSKANSSPLAGLSLGREVLSGFGNRRAFSGQEVDAAADGLVHVRYRVHHAGVGRWLRRDPKEQVDGPNLYVYIRDNPKYLDPFGTSTSDSSPKKGCQPRFFIDGSGGFSRCYELKIKVGAGFVKLDQGDCEEPNPKCKAMVMFDYDIEPKDPPPRGCNPDDEWDDWHDSSGKVDWHDVINCADSCGRLIVTPRPGGPGGKFSQGRSTLKAEAKCTRCPCDYHLWAVSVDGQQLVRAVFRFSCTLCPEDPPPPPPD